MKNNKKLSIIVPIYNTECYLNKCLDSLLNQTYNNIEVICVNDASKGNCKEIIDGYKKRDNRVRYVEHEVNKGLFQARLTGADLATGEYISFLDSDDYVSVDYYRTLMDKIQEENADIAVGNMVIENEDGTKRINNLFSCKSNTNIYNDNIFKNYFRQHGLSFDWYVIWNKIYKKELWNKARPHYNGIKKHLIMTEDIAYSTVLHYYAKKLVFGSINNAIYYCQHESASTNQKKSNYKNIDKNLDDLLLSFSFVENFIDEHKVDSSIKEDFILWKRHFKRMWLEVINSNNIPDESKKKLLDKINKFCNEKEKYFIPLDNEKTSWNESLEKIKLQIIDNNTKVVSFDVFDTLVLRPFLRPTDLFELLNEYFEEQYGKKTGLNFSDARVLCEHLTRKKIKNREEITLDEIYETIYEEYNIKKSILNLMKKREIELEIRFNYRRNIGYELYTLAKLMNKKVVVSSDMYLSQNTIKKILQKNGYNDFDFYFVSSEVNKTKSTGSLFEYLLKTLKCEPNEVVHIGDNYNSDSCIPQKYGIRSCHLYRAIDVAFDTNMVNEMTAMFNKSMPFWKDNANSMNFIGIRSMIALVANKYFDNPFIPFNKESDFNGDPYLIGYYNLGMYLFAISKWLCDKTQSKYDSLVFMARDGYLPMEAYNIFKKVYKNIPEAKYFYTSRKALFTVNIQSELDLYKLSESINISNHSPKEIVNYISECIDYDEEKIKKECTKNKIKYDQPIGDISVFNRFIRIIIDKFYKQEIVDNLQLKYKKYFSSIFSGRTSTFDVGYSGRPEMYLSFLIKKPIDTFFLNINADIGLKHARKANYNLYTFFDGKPAITGMNYESMISALAPSCIKYKVLEDGTVEPVFEKYKKTFNEEYIFGIMQNGALDFVNDMIDVFGEDIHQLYFENYYASMPIMAYINSSKRFDRQMFDGIFFEDDVGLKELNSINYLIENEMKWHNQTNLYSLINHNKNTNSSFHNVDLSNRNRLVKAIFYLLYDRETFKMRMNVLFKHKGLFYYTGKFMYRALRKIRNIVYSFGKKN